MQPLIRYFKPAMIFIIILLITTFFSRHGDCEQDHPPLESPPEESMVQQIAPQVDKTQEQISRGVTSSAVWFDSFFRDETYEVEKNTSYLRIRLDAFQESGERTEFNFTPRLKLVLPYLQRKFQVEIMGSADEDLEVYDDIPPLENRQVTESQKFPASATLRYFIKTKDTLNLSLAAGAFIDDSQPHFHFGPRSRISFNHQWGEITFIQWLRWLTNEGLESETRIDIDYELCEPFLFRNRLEGDWSDDEDEFLHSISFLLYHQLSNRRVLVYEWNNLFTNRPHHRMEETNIRLKYRQRIWRDWLFAELAPQLSFPRDNDFKRTPGILFRIEIFFGLLE
jgi:hypothetical protein